MNNTTTTCKYSRLQYLNGECTHNEYYEQFAKPFVSAIKNRFGLKKLKAAYSEDIHFNKIPLASWDSLANTYARFSTETNSKLRECGDYPTLGGWVCILKAAARMAIGK